MKCFLMSHCMPGNIKGSVMRDINHAMENYGRLFSRMKMFRWSEPRIDSWFENSFSRTPMK